jgi:tetratricopeptide (TPR) repeat protein
MYPQAIELLNKRINDEPTDADAHFVLATAYLQTGNLKGADERFASAVRLKPDYGYQIGGEFKKGGDAALQEGNTNKAISLYNSAIRYQPNLKEPIGNALFEKGKAFADSGNDAKAIEAHKYAYSILPSLGPKLGKFYGDKATNAKQSSDKARMLRTASEFDSSYKAEASKVEQVAVQEEAGRRVANAKADLENAMSADLETWVRTIENAQKYLSADDIIEFGGKYFQKQYANITPFSVDPKDGWKTMATIRDKQRVRYIANESFEMMDDAWKVSVKCSAELSKPGGVRFSGREKLVVSFKSSQ